MELIVSSSSNVPEKADSEVTEPDLVARALNWTEIMIRNMHAKNMRILLPNPPNMREKCEYKMCFKSGQ